MVTLVPPAGVTELQASAQKAAPGTLTGTLTQSCWRVRGPTHPTQPRPSQTQLTPRFCRGARANVLFAARAAPRTRGSVATTKITLICEGRFQVKRTPLMITQFA